MSQFLFRGQCKKNKQWVEGFIYEHEPPLQCLVSKNYVPEKSKWYIVRTGFADWNMPRQPEFIEVEQNTIGFFTQKNDKTGKKIFTGDCFLDGEDMGIIVFENGTFKINWYGIAGAVMPYGYDEDAGGYDIVGSDNLEDFDMSQYEIVCNRYDHPEVLNGDILKVLNAQNAQNNKNDK